MNSFLQMLFMDPEFREKIYKIKYSQEIHGDIDYFIPYQLSKVFAKLQ